MLINRHVRDEARSAQESLERLGRYAGGFSTTCGLAASAYTSLASAYRSLLSLSAAAGLISALSFRAADVKRRIANDPADDDYRSHTWFNEPRVYPELILEDLPPGDIHGVRPLIELASTLATSSPNESAMLRAFERAAGAYRHGDEAAANDRLAEQSRYAESATSTLAKAATLAQQGATELELEDAAYPPEDPRIYGTLDRLLPADVLASLYRAGISITQLRRHTVGPASRAEMVAGLRSAAADMENLASALVEWDARLDARRLERPQTRGRFVIYERFGEYGWRLLTPEQRVVLDTGTVFLTRESALANIYAITENAADAQISEE